MTLIFCNNNSFWTWQDSVIKTANQWDADGTCPDSISGDAWDYADNDNVIIGGNRVVILDHSVNVKNLIIEDGGKSGFFFVNF